MDDYEIGTTPVSTDFIYYGTRKIRIVKDGYETLTVMQPFPAPWYEFPPADFITENFVPGKIRDQRILDYQLKPQMIVPTDQLLSRAEGLRHNNLITPAGPSVGPAQCIRSQYATRAQTDFTRHIARNRARSPILIRPRTLRFRQALRSAGSPVPPNAYQPPAGIGGQTVYELPPR